MATKSKKLIKGDDTACGRGKKGFTIIEVVLVLAIAGLIFLMVFIALPALQQAQRNTQRENDLSRFLTAVTDFQSNNNGQLPFTNTSNATGIGVMTGANTIALLANAGQTFATRYIDAGCGNITLGAAMAGACGDQFTDPDGTIYRFAALPNPNAGAVTFPAFNAANHTVYVAPGFICGATEATVRQGTGPRQIALFMVLEGGAVTCNDNQ